MAIGYRGLRSITARELIRALMRDGFHFGPPNRLSSAVSAPRWPARHRSAAWRRRYVHDEDTKSIIEAQAQWTEEDLKRLKLL